MRFRRATSWATGVRTEREGYRIGDADAVKGDLAAKEVDDVPGSREQFTSSHWIRDRARSNQIADYPLDISLPGVNDPPDPPTPVIGDVERPIRSFGHAHRSMTRRLWKRTV